MKNLSKRDCSILIANSIDHFDTALYGFLAPIFAASFFPSKDPLISLILAYSVFATNIVTRPLGSYIFGTIALSFGPAMSLCYSLIGVAITTAALGFLPAYEHIGICAPILLIILRSLSGICSSGETTIAKLFILSDRTNIESNKNSYLYQTSSMVGIVLASFASTIVLAEGMENYWRICFIMGGLCALFGYRLRNMEGGVDMKKTTRHSGSEAIGNLRRDDAYHSRTSEIPDSRFAKAKRPSFSSFRNDSFLSITLIPPSLQTLWQNKTLLLRIAVVSGFSYTTYSIPFIVMNNLIPHFTKFTLEDMMQINTILLVVDMALLPVVGHSLLKISSKSTLYYCAILLFISALPALYFMQNASLTYVIAVKLWIIIIGLAFCCKINIWCNDLIKGKEKYLIVGIGGSIGAATIGKMAPAICLTLYYYIPSPAVMGVFIMAVAGATIWAAGE